MNFMKRFAFLFLLLNIYFVAYTQKTPTEICQYGFTFEISTQKNWGYGQPVILSITPNTSADAAGLRIYDIIEKINEMPTAGENIETIITWLKNSSNQIQLTVSNLSGTQISRTLDKYCRKSNSLSEKDIASVYSFYSLENVQTRAFDCPFKTTVNPEFNLIQYANFGFAVPDPDNLELEKKINAIIQKSLEQKGLKYSEKNPDLIIQTQYYNEANLNFRNNNNTDKLPVVCRYNLRTKSMDNLPIYYNPLININQAKFFLKLAIKLIDNKKRNNSVVWECEANELLQSDYSLADYAEFHVPLMFMQYPYPKSTEVAKFYYSRAKYNFTGINYNMDKIKEISEVIPSSPASKAGIKAGDIIENINGIKFESNAKTADNKYRQFIFKTLQLRNPATQFTNAEGFTRCMYWDERKYFLIQNEFNKPDFSTAFSYLFYFEPYINSSDMNIVNFSIKRGRQKQEIRIIPVIVTEEIFMLTGDR